MPEGTRTEIGPMQHQHKEVHISKDKKQIDMPSQTKFILKKIVSVKSCMPHIRDYR